MRITRAQRSDRPQLAALLEAANLPSGHLSEAEFFVAREGGSLAACVGLEVYGHTALLRSLAVASTHRGTGLGRQMVDCVMETAERRGATHVVVLTADAVPYFSHLGFDQVERSAIQGAVIDSWQFRAQVCQSAVCMYKHV